jgi:hypothetical protein
MAMASVIRIEPVDVTVLMAADARIDGDMFVAKANFSRQHAANWREAADVFYWTVESPEAADYEIIALMYGDGEIVIEAAPGTPPFSSREIPVVEGGSGLFAGVGDMQRASRGWDRVLLQPIHLQSGLNTVKLHSRDTPDQPMQLYSLELVQRDVRLAMEEEARGFRSDPSWLGAAGYGVMFQWTNRSEPRRGIKKPWPQTVDDFDVDRFTEMILETGASYVIWTSSWGPQYVPAPIASIDRLLPGRTSERDLIGEMMDVLGRHGIRVMLYYHSGYDCYHSIDREWFQAMGGYKADKTEFFTHFCEIVTEMGMRYGKRLAGWFFDGALRYYDPHYDGSPLVGPGHAPWRAMGLAAKAGNRDRIISYNSFNKPRLTELQEFYSGEGYRSNSLVPRGGSGIFTEGPYQGLQAHTCFILEKAWGHLEKSADIAPPKYSAEQLCEMIEDGISRRSALSINMEMYEDGSVSPMSLELLKRVRQRIRGG